MNESGDCLRLDRRFPHTRQSTPLSSHSAHATRNEGPHRGRVALGLIILVLQAGLAGQATVQQKPASAPSPLLLTITVTDSRDRPVTGLAKEQFFVVDGNVKWNVVDATAGPVPANIAVVVDVSESMSRYHSRMRIALTALQSLIAQSHDLNAYSLLTAGRQAQLLVDWTRNRSTIAAGIERLYARQSFQDTALYDAVVQAAARLERGPNIRRVIIVITDGEDTSSRLSFADVEERLERGNVLLYALNVRRDSHPGDYGRRALIELASESGGLALFARGDEEISESVARIASELSTQYAVAVVPAVKAGRKTRAVKVGVTGTADHPLKVRARLKYRLSES